MKEQVKSTKHKFKALIKHVQLGAILPFTETPSEEFLEDNKQAGDKITASDLFAMFTADIIKKDVIFTR